MIIFRLCTKFIINPRIIFGIATGILIGKRQRLDGNTQPKSEFDCTVINVEFLGPLPVLAFDSWRLPSAKGNIPGKSRRKAFEIFWARAREKHSAKFFFFMLSIENARVLITKRFARGEFEFLRNGHDEELELPIWIAPDHP